MSHHETSHDFYAKRQEFFLEVSQPQRLFLMALIGVGVLAFLGGLVSGEPTRAWGSLLFNCLFFFSIAVGGVAFGHMQDVIDAEWGRPIKRMHEAFGSFIPVAASVLAVFLICVRFDIFGAQAVFSWIKNPEQVTHFWGKSTWLEPNFMLIRDLFSLAVIAGLSHWQMTLVTKRDLAFAAGKKDLANQLAHRAGEILHYWSAPVLVVYALAFTVIVTDLAMSLAPTWFSTLWAGWMFAIMMQTLMATNLLMMFYLKTTKVGEYIGRQQFHDVGKIMHGFTIFFAYLTFAHILTYWYTNIPEETSYFMTRMQKPWFCWLILSPICSFLIPVFALVPKASKWTAKRTIPIATLILSAQWLAYLLVVMPQIGVNISLPWVEVGLLCGFLGLFLATFFNFVRKVPALPIADPLLK